MLGSSFTLALVPCLFFGSLEFCQVLTHFSHPEPHWQFQQVHESMTSFMVPTLSDQRPNEAGLVQCEL